MSGITTHVLDTSRGRPAVGVAVRLSHQASSGDWEAVGRGMTDADGRVSDLVGETASLREGVYRLTFETGVWFAQRESPCFYPQVDITFEVTDASEHHHVPLLLSPWGYTTYRGS